MPVMSLMMLASSMSRIFPYWGWEEGIISACKRYPMDLNHFLLIFQSAGFYFATHRRTILFISGATSAIN